MRLELAPKVWYRFKTLSLYDVWALWPHILPLMRALDQPLLWVDHLHEMLKVLNPTLAAVPEHFALIRPAHVDFLLDFYRRQDWARIRELGGFLSEDAPEAEKRAAEREEVPRVEADRRFMVICTAAARSVDMSPLEFMQERFEFCADVIVNLRSALEYEKNKDKIPTDKFFDLMQSIMPNSKVTEETKPAWVREAEEYAKNAGKN